MLKPNKLEKNSFLSNNGAAMKNAKLHPGCKAFLERCRLEEVEVHIISHKTKFSPHDPQRVDMQKMAWYVPLRGRKPKYVQGANQARTSLNRRRRIFVHAFRIKWSRPMGL